MSFNLRSSRKIFRCGVSELMAIGCTFNGACLIFVINIGFCVLSDA